MIIKRIDQDSEKYKQLLANYVNRGNMQFINTLFPIVQRNIILMVYNEYKLKNGASFFQVYAELFPELMGYFEKINKISEIENKYSLQNVLGFCWNIIDKYFVDYDSANNTDLELDALYIAEYYTLLMQEERSINPHFQREIMDVFTISKEYAEMTYHYAMSLLIDFLYDKSSNYCEKYFSKVILKRKDISPIFKKLFIGMCSDIGAENVIRFLLKFGGMTITFPSIQVENFIQLNEEESDTNVEELL